MARDRRKYYSLCLELLSLLDEFFLFSLVLFNLVLEHVSDGLVSRGVEMVSQNYLFLSI